MGLWRHTSPDDRGKAVPVVQVNDLRDPANIWRWQDREAADLAGRIMTIAADEQQKMSWRVGLVFGLSMMVMMLVMGIGAGAGWLPQRLLLPLAVVFGGGIGLAFQLQGRRRAAPEVRKTTLSRRRCAACGYSLQGCIVQSDGCVVCPECEAAWSVAKLDAPGLNAGDAVPPAPPVPEGARVPDAAGYFARLRRRFSYVTDDEGKKVPVADYRLRAAIGRETNAGVKSRLEAAREAMRPCAVRVLLRGLAVVGLLAILGFQIWNSGRAVGSLLATGPSTLTWSRAGHLVVPVLGVIFWLFIGVLWLLIFRERGLAPRAGAVRQRMLMKGLCPSCAADVSGVPTGAPMPVRCAKCGAAWKLLVTGEDPWGERVTRAGGGVMAEGPAGAGPPLAGGKSEREQT